MCAGFDVNKVGDARIGFVGEHEMPQHATKCLLFLPPAADAAAVAPAGCLLLTPRPGHPATPLLTARLPFCGQVNTANKADWDFFRGTSHHACSSIDSVRCCCPLLPAAAPLAAPSAPPAVATLTHRAQAAAYEFTTLTCVPGIVRYRGAAASAAQGYTFVCARILEHRQSSATSSVCICVIIIIWLRLIPFPFPSPASF
jgi:hypothetical protein